jgi:aminopeptidase
MIAEGGENSRPGAVLPANELARYADAIVLGCLGLTAGELLLVRALPSQRELAVALAEAGHRAGARLVDVDYRDPLVQAARIRYAADDDLGPLTPWERAWMRATIEPDAAIVFLLPNSEAGAFDGLPPERVATDHAEVVRRLGRLRRAFQQGRRRWTGAAWPTPDWASQLFPGEDTVDAQRRLARELLEFCRLGPDDPPGFAGWERHAERIAERASMLTELGLERLEIRDAGTSLDLRLAPGSRWLGGPRLNAHGRRVAANFPTEESFTSPEPRSTAGAFRCSRPLFFRGRTIDGIAGEFRNGRLIRLAAANDDDRDFLAAALDTDPGARRLGEVALVDASSRIGRAGRIYLNTLLDENAAAHIAFGSGFDATRMREPNTRVRGVNRSLIHLDVMIGTDALEATGFTGAGRRVPLVAEGEWRVP